MTEICYDIQPLSPGVPQDSILASTLFSDELLSQPQHCQILAYADDAITLFSLTIFSFLIHNLIMTYSS